MGPNRLTLVTFSDVWKGVGNLQRGGHKKRPPGRTIQIDSSRGSWVQSRACSQILRSFFLMPAMLSRLPLRGRHTRFCRRWMALENIERGRLLLRGRHARDCIRRTSAKPPGSLSMQKPIAIPNTPPITATIPASVMVWAIHTRRPRSAAFGSIHAV